MTKIDLDAMYKNVRTNGVIATTTDEILALIAQCREAEAAVDAIAGCCTSARNEAYEEAASVVEELFAHKAVASAVATKIRNLKEKP